MWSTIETPRALCMRVDRKNAAIHHQTANLVTMPTEMYTSQEGLRVTTKPTKKLRTHMTVQEGLSRHRLRIRWLTTRPQNISNGGTLVVNANPRKSSKLDLHPIRAKLAASPRSNHLLA